LPRAFVRQADAKATRWLVVLRHPPLAQPRAHLLLESVRVRTARRRLVLETHGQPLARKGLDGAEPEEPQAARGHRTSHAPPSSERHAETKSESPRSGSR